MTKNQPETERFLKPIFSRVKGGGILENVIAAVVVL